MVPVVFQGPQKRTFRTKAFRYPWPPARLNIRDGDGALWGRNPRSFLEGGAPAFQMGSSITKTPVEGSGFAQGRPALRPSSNQPGPRLIVLGGRVSERGGTSPWAAEKRAALRFAPANQRNYGR